MSHLARMQTLPLPCPSMAAANNAQIVILLSCITQIQALQAQILIMATPEQLPWPVPLLLIGRII